MCQFRYNFCLNLSKKNSRRHTVFGQAIFNFNYSWLISVQQQIQNVIICQSNR